MIATKERGISTGQLVRDLAADVRTLMRQELALARAEVLEELERVLVAVGLLAAAAVALAAGGLWILIALTRGIAAIFNWPLSGVYAGIGIALAIMGVALLVVVWRQVRTLRILPQTRETLREHARRAAGYVEGSAARGV